MGHGWEEEETGLGEEIPGIGNNRSKGTEARMQRCSLGRRQESREGRLQSMKGKTRLWSVP